MTTYRLVLLGTLLIAILVLTAACGAGSRGNATQPASQASVVPESPADLATPAEISESSSTAMPAIELMATATPTSTPSPALEPTATATAEALASPTPEPQPTKTATLEPTATDTPRPAQAVAILSGELKGVGGDYTGSGLATVYQQDGDDRTLEFTEFSVTRGPGLVVLLSNNPDVHLTRNIGQYVELGDLQDFSGDQTYQIPTDLDLSEYSVAVIYCKPFNAVFATVTLQ